MQCWGPKEGNPTHIEAGLRAASREKGPKKSKRRRSKHVKDLGNRRSKRAPSSSKSGRPIQSDKNEAIYKPQEDSIQSSAECQWLGSAGKMEEQGMSPDGQKKQEGVEDDVEKEI